MVSTILARPQPVTVYSLALLDVAYPREVIFESYYFMNWFPFVFESSISRPVAYSPFICRCVKAVICIFSAYLSDCNSRQIVVISGCICWLGRAGS